MNWFLSHQLCREEERRTPRRSPLQRRRALALESLESRALLAALPYGAMPDDTGEYMLGDVYVNVVLMESDPTKSPGDNNPVPAGRRAPAENWATNSVNTIAAVKQKVQEGLDWWENTLAQALAGTPAAGRDLLDFTIDWTFADNPVRTGYEPIARTSNDFTLWMYDFLNQVGFNQTGNFSTDIRAYNNFKRTQSGSDWAFTIFVVNDEVDTDNAFATGGQFSRAFSYAGGRFAVIPSSRPASTFAHEVGHAFWSLDEYLGTTANYQTRRGYYNAPNSNHASHPDFNPDNPPAISQQDSIMANDPSRENAWGSNVTSDSSRELLGWRDTDDDGLFDVLDVPFMLEGVGRYDSSLGQYLFSGSSGVRTLPNLNSSGLQNDITINQIRAVQYSIDGGSWTTIQTLPARTYQTTLDIGIPVSPGNHTIKIRTIDTRTGAMSPEFVGEMDVPSQTPQPGISGFVFQDDDADGNWDNGEQPLPDWALTLINESGEELELQRRVEPNQYTELALLNTVNAEVTLTAVGSEVVNNQVKAKTTNKAVGAGRVFANNSVVLGSNLDTWNSSRQLRIDFTNPVSSVSLRAYGATTSGGFARLEIYNSAGVMLERYTTSAISSNISETMTLRRGAGDIAFAVAYGHVGTDVVLDTLEWGPAASATSNTLGAYSLASLPAGDYLVRLDLPPLHVLTTFASNVVEFTLAAGQALADMNFGIARNENLWHNLAVALNVSGDEEGDISPLDALLVINWLNSHPDSALPSSATPEVDGYVDVNDDGFCTPLDALLVINHLNVPPGLQLVGSGGTPPGSSGSALAPASAPPDATPAEGEETPHNAAEYYALQPLHFAAIAGDEEVCVHDDEIGHLDHDHLMPESISIVGSFTPLFFSLDSPLAGSRLHTVVEETRTELETHLGDVLAEDQSQSVLDHVHRAFSTVAQAADELDEALEAIAPEVADSWQLAIERILRRLPHGLG